jgi:hypothetical protein
MDRVAWATITAITGTIAAAATIAAIAAIAATTIAAIVRRRYRVTITIYSIILM